ncbi:MAG: DNA cytosine methyltransferase [Bacteroidales bacterium]|jgi:DNA (cytosine-5)-methyltransferase 1|nr:DNA cytosine methyltransferase [Bacteroidales bacterium]
MDKKLAIFSFFSGSGFLDLGFEKTGYNIDFVNEYSESFLNAYKYSRKKMNLRSPAYGYHNTNADNYCNSLKNELFDYIVDAQKNNRYIGFIGGPPCPDFSVGGKNKGKDGENGKLSSTYINLIINMKPDFFLFENVKGLWRTSYHRAFYEDLKKRLYKVGYCTTERLTNAIEFGVPQDRDRILLFGVNKDILKRGYYKEERLLNFRWNSNISYTLDQVRAIDWPNTDSFIEESQKEPNAQLIRELTIQRWFEKNDVLNHPNATAYFKPRAGLSRMQSIDEGDVRGKSYKRLHRWRYSPTAAYGNNEVHLHPYKARRISASEAMAIQSLPKEFELPREMSLSDMFKTIGNGVPYLLSKALAETMKDYLDAAVCKE